MKATVSTKALEKALDFVVAEKCTTLPVLNRTVAIMTDKDHLIVYSTDLEITMSARIPAEVSEEGGAVVTKSMLQNYLSKKSDTMVLHCWDKKDVRVVDENTNAAESGGRLHVTCKDVQGWMEDLEIKQYPKNEYGTFRKFVYLNDKTLDILANCISEFASKSSLRPVLSGMLINERVAVATDSYMLGEYIHDPSVKEKDVRDNDGHPSGVIVPVKPLHHLYKHAMWCRLDVNEARTFVRYYIDRDEVNDVECVVYSRVIDGKFPSYDQVMIKPADIKATLLIPRNDLLKAVKRLHPIAKEINSNIRYEVKKGDATLTLSSKHRSAAMSVNVQLKDDAQEYVKVALSSEYVVRAINTLDCDHVEMDYCDSMHAAEFRCAGEGQRTLLVMPLRIQED